MLRRLLLIIPFCVGCNEVSRAHLMDAAANVALAGAVLLVGAIAQDAAENGWRDGPTGHLSTDEVDEQGRRARLIARVRCDGDRSYKLLCVPRENCYFETNDARILHCATRDCDDTPPGLLEWCKGNK